MYYKLNILFTVAGVFLNRSLQDSLWPPAVFWAVTLVLLLATVAFLCLHAEQMPTSKAADLFFCLLLE